MATKFFCHAATSSCRTNRLSGESRNRTGESAFLADSTGTASTVNPWNLRFPT